MFRNVEIIQNDQMLIQDQGGDHDNSRYIYENRFGIMSE
jgi:hypothetical protein